MNALVTAAEEVSRIRKARADLDDRLVAHVTSVGEASATEVAFAFGEPRDSARYQLSMLVNAGRLERVSRPRPGFPSRVVFRLPGGAR